MITHYIQAVRNALGGLLDLVVQLALPIAIGLGLIAAALMLTAIFRKDGDWRTNFDWRARLTAASGYALVGVFLVACWGALRVVRPLAQQDISWRARAEATANPTPDAPPVYQYGPALAALAEKTYTRTLRLPPSFLARIGENGVGVLAPYLTDPSAENVLRLRDTFRRSGRDVVFTREATLLNEEPIPFSDSQVTVNFQRLAGRAYDANFEGHYSFGNSNAQARDIHFLFTLPQDSTIQDLHVSVGKEEITEPNDGGAYEWKATLPAGAKREAVVRYRVVGARVWRYDLGSQRRRVQKFGLQAKAGGPVKFLRGSLQPASQAGSTLTWDLNNVITAQQIALVFPTDTLGQQLYLQALSALPASLVIFLLGVAALGLWRGQLASPPRLMGGLLLFALGLGAASVLTIYLGVIAGVLLGPLLGALLATLALERRSLLASLPAALFPVTFLSAQNTGLLVLALAAVTLVAVLWTQRQTMKEEG